MSIPSPLTDAIEVDITEHDLSAHKFLPHAASPSWYMSWNKKGNCPICHVPTRFVGMPRDEAMPIIEKSLTLQLNPVANGSYNIVERTGDM